MRIAMISEHASPLATLGGVDAGGQNVHVAALAREIARRGHEVVVHTRRDDPTLPREVDFAPGVVVDHVDAGPPLPLPKDLLLPYMDAFALDLVRAWRRRRPDVVHAHFWMSGVAALGAARRVRVPVLETFHALGIVKRRHQGARDTSPRRRLHEERRIIATADGIIATCHDELAELVRLGAAAERVAVVPCGVDLAVFRPDVPPEPRSSRRRLVAVGRLVERKGIDDAIAALVRLPDAELVVAGGPAREELHRDPEARRLVARAAELGVADRVVLRGRVDHRDVPPLLRSADVVVSVPWYEPFGIVPVEAMACGVPVVASAVGGMLDTVVDGVTGLHVAPRAPEELARAVRRLLDDGRLPTRLGAAGTERARARYGWERVADATLQAYARLGAEPREAERPPHAVVVARGPRVRRGSSVRTERRRAARARGDRGAE
jgi:D-inositol-3-phosphate glycosyltransferase